MQFSVSSHSTGCFETINKWNSSTYLNDEMVPVFSKLVTEGDLIKLIKAQVLLLILTVYANGKYNGDTRIIIRIIAL